MSKLIMTALVKNRINRLSRVLKNESAVEFKHNDFFYEIFESATDAGYVVNLYSDNTKDEDGYRDENLIDGGLCITDNARDAIEFML